MDEHNARIIDFAVFLAANFINLLTAAVFIVRWKGFPKTEYVLGLIVILLSLPSVAALVLNFHQHRGWWSIVFPALLIFYCIVELFLDYILKINFRNNPAIHTPYIIFYYFALIGMVGYSFALGKMFGFFTLATYFLNLGISWFVHTRPPGG